MAKVDINKVELVWPGKYNDDGTLKEIPHVNLPFQVIERVNESRATRDAKKRPSQLSLFDVWDAKEGKTFEDGWRNKLIWGDNLYVMSSLLKFFSGTIDLIYIDPPFATGADFTIKTTLGDDEVTKEQSIIEEKAYRDTWGKGINSYIYMIYDRLVLIRELLSNKGCLYVHCDWRMSSIFRFILDEVFGENCFVNEIIWHYKTFQGQTHRYFARKHDNLFLYAKSDAFTYNEQFGTEFEDTIDSQRWMAYLNEKHQIVGANMPTQDSRFIRYLKKWIKKYGREPGPEDVVFEVVGQPVDSVWDLKGLDPKSHERLGYATQKPESLLERIIQASSNEGDIVADFFCGSGTTLAVAEKYGRRWIGCDLGRWAIHVSRKRLLEIEGCKSFEIINLGKYERQYWQSITFPKKGEPEQHALYEYLAFILKLYGAQPISGTQHLHGKKGKALVHIGAVDAPVTIDEVNDALIECLILKQNELHILGWEWEMGLNDLMVDEAKRQDVKLVFMQIPREVMEQQAVDKGDIHFFELAYLEVDSETKRLDVQVTLKDFVIPNTELIPEDVREKVQKWSDYIDYWAVDWNFQEDTFIHGWVAYRTRQNRSLPLISDKHTYENPGTYTIVVKVIDIFGNDTTQAYKIEVK